MQSAHFHGKSDPTREIEVKLRVQDAAQMAAVLVANGFVVVHPRAFEANEVFDTPERALRAERRLLRLREFAGAATLTYKGTPETGRYKSREELETVISDAGALRQILDRLGLRLFFRYEKYRTIYQRPGDTAGLVVLDETPIGLWLELEGAPVTVLARASSAVLADVLQRATVLAAADLAGIARASVARTVEYDSQRVQFGRPVGSFQALKHELANLHVAVTMAEQAVLYAAHAIDAGLPDAALAVAVAKSKASATAKLASAAMIQFHGGIGFTWEHDAHFYFKRAKRLGAAFGDAEFHRERIVHLLMDGDA